MNDTHSLAHTKWNCKYHIVFAPKFRRKVFFGEKKREIGKILRQLCEWKKVTIVEAEICPDHVHMLLEIPPKIAVSSFVGYLKGKSSLMIYEAYPNLKFKYRNREFWCRGYYVDTVGKNAKKISWLTNDTESIMEQSFSSLFSVLSGTVTALFSICALSFISIYVGIAAVVLFFFVSVLPQLLTKGLQKENKKRSVAQEKGVESFKDAVMGLPVFLMSNRLTEFSNRIAASSSRLEQSNYNFQKKNVGVQTFVISTSLVGQTILLSLTVLAAILGVAPIGAVLAVGNLAGSFFGNVSEAAGSFTRLKASKTLWEKFKVDSLEETKKALPGKIEKIRIEGLSYHYNDSQELHFKDTEFRANGKYAIVGESGSGKTTLVKLLMGLLPDYTGNILYGPSELRDISEESIFENIAYVEQKVYLFQDTVRFNLTLGKDYPEDRINNVLRHCRLESYVASLPKGLDSVIEEDGKNMSGGQRQRIAIARAMLRNIHLIILDEGTSALDEATALDIEQNLVQDPELGVIIITHNLKEKVKDSLDGVYMVGA